ncbi:hypothetical protein MVLG_01965 [Microbotryum lychnidis-dioicae p1A1 Lamole]|uniref:Uncharacterized protein n=1 Tax=Microbotryum lychnidis-dioicae (strain p1A1 Lamole / MvSl-1064) TaxID=683840 RepID=U5H3Q4_USTV1|nr:hypothetical protein MVLG_01965 [Microbotryum lychnidis-dioicae p1A1 Lamole]|eukprot:KDE07871.1 hypothetical protein MVLG_01965 [Microbotryum lychnidis-dioicae p1A1 Lamole]
MRADYNAIEDLSDEAALRPLAIMLITLARLLIGANVVKEDLEAANAAEEAATRALPEKSIDQRNAPNAPVQQGGTNPTTLWRQQTRVDVARNQGLSKLGANPSDGLDTLVKLMEMWHVSTDPSLFEPKTIPNFPEPLNILAIFKLKHERIAGLATRADIRKEMTSGSGRVTAVDRGHSGTQQQGRSPGHAQTRAPSGYLLLTIGRYVSQKAGFCARMHSVHEAEPAKINETELVSISLTPGTQAPGCIPGHISRNCSGSPVNDVERCLRSLVRANSVLNRGPRNAHRTRMVALLAEDDQLNMIDLYKTLAQLPSTDNLEDQDFLDA